jgi:hypothetical protein
VNNGSKRVEQYATMRSRRPIENNESKNGKNNEAQQAGWRRRISKRKRKGT